MTGPHRGVRKTVRRSRSVVGNQDQLARGLSLLEAATGLGPRARGKVRPSVMRRAEARRVVDAVVAFAKEQAERTAAAGGPVRVETLRARRP
jgi:hypothetical protein